MNTLQISVFLFISLLMCSACSKKEAINYQNIHVDEAKKLKSSSDEIIFLDVRTPEEIAEGKIDGAVEIDYRGENFKEAISQLNKDDTYIVYCRSGRRSAETSEMMIEMGFSDVKNLDGGILAWNEKEK